MVKMTRATLSVVLQTIFGLMPALNFAFAPIQSFSHSISSVTPKITLADKSATYRKFPLSAKDTIFSLNDDDETSEEIEGSGNDDIEGIVNSMLEDVENANSNDDSPNTTESADKKRIGDPLREDNGVRPSIHPTAINAIAEALKARASQSIKAKKKPKSNNDDDDDFMHFRTSETVEPLMVMVTAGQFASDAIQKRQESSEEDGMLLNQGEEQTLAGRVMGVIMRFDDLEAELAERTSGVDWVAKYDEWGSFGVLEDEQNRDDSDGGDDDDDGLGKVHQKILDDPLFCMNRAECLLAIFLEEVEIPQLKKLNETVPDESKIDFLDDDRREVVLRNE